MGRKIAAPLNLRIVLLLEGDKVTIKSLKRLLVLALTLALRLNTQEPALALQVLRRKGTPSCQRWRGTGRRSRTYGPSALAGATSTT